VLVVSEDPRNLRNALDISRACLVGARLFLACLDGSLIGFLAILGKEIVKILFNLLDALLGLLFSLVYVALYNGFVLLEYGLNLIYFFFYLVLE